MTFADRGPVARRALPYAASLAALLVAAGCTSGTPTPTASTAMPSTASSSTTPAATSTTTAKPTPVVDAVIAKIPAAARPETEAGAAAFARHYFEALNRAATTPDPGLLEGLFTPGCKTCAAMSASIADLEEAGQRHAGPTIRVAGVSTDSFVAEKRVLLVQVDQTAVDVIDTSGRKVDRTIAAKGAAFAMTLSFDNGHWAVSRLQTVTK